METEDIFLIGPIREDNDLPINTIPLCEQKFSGQILTDVFTFVVQNKETKAIKPLITESGEIPTFSSEEKAVEWILK